MRISAIQMNPGADKKQNIAQARDLIQGALADGRPRIVALPEMWSCLRLSPTACASATRLSRSTFATPRRNPRLTYGRRIPPSPNSASTA